MAARYSSRNNDAEPAGDSTPAVDDEYAEVWKGLEALEAFVTQLQTNPQKFVETWDARLVHLKLRQSLIIGETIAYFIGDTEVMTGDDFLQGKLSAKHVSQFLSYPTNHIYRLLKSEYEYITPIKERYRDNNSKREVRRGTFNRYKFIPTEKPSAAISHYEQVAELYINHQAAAKKLMLDLLRSGYFQRFMRVQWKLQCSIMDALGYDRIFEFLRLHIPQRHKQLFDQHRDEIIEGMKRAHLIWKDERLLEESIEYVISKMVTDPLVSLRHWLEISAPEGADIDMEPTEPDSRSFSCDSCRLSFVSKNDLIGHKKRAHAKTE